MSDELLTVEEVADILKVPKSWVYGRTRRRGAERMPHIKIGKYLRFDEGTIREWIRKWATV